MNCSLSHSPATQDWWLPVALSAVLAMLFASEPLNGQERSGQTHFFGLNGQGSRFVYVFDRSLSMQGAPLAVAKQELLASLARLDRIHQFQIVFYNERPRLISSSQMLFADENGRREAESFVGSIQAAGGTDHALALKLALRLSPDVIFFLTDADDPPLTQRQLEEIHRANAVSAVNVIQFKAGPEPTNTNFLKQMAEQNQGAYKYIDINKLDPDK